MLLYNVGCANYQLFGNTNQLHKIIFCDVFTGCLAAPKWPKISFFFVCFCFVNSVPVQQTADVSVYQAAKVKCSNSLHLELKKNHPSTKKSAVSWSFKSEFQVGNSCKLHPTQVHQQKHTLTSPQYDSTQWTVQNYYFNYYFTSCSVCVVKHAVTTLWLPFQFRSRYTDWKSGSPTQNYRLLTCSGILAFAAQTKELQNWSEVIDFFIHSEPSVGILWLTPPRSQDSNQWINQWTSE